MADVETLPETQRTALLLREIDQLSYEEIAQAMQTTVPSVKSLLVRARIGLAESGQSRLLTCDEVQLTLAEAAEGIGKASGATRKHVRDCDGCKAFRDQLRSDRKAMAALFPVGLIALFKQGVLAKIFGGGSAAGSAAGGTGAVGAAGGASAASGMSGISILGGAIGAKAAAGFATAAILTAGAVEVRNMGAGDNDNPTPKATAVAAVQPVAKTDDSPHIQLVAQPPAHAERSDDAAPNTTDTANRDAGAAPPPKTQDESPKPATDEPAAVDPPVDDGDVAVGTPVVPTIIDGDGDQDTGSAPEEPTTPTAPTTPLVPTTPTVPVTPPVVAPPSADGVVTTPVTP